MVTTPNHLLEPPPRGLFLLVVAFRLMHNLRNALKWATDHAAQLLNVAKIVTVLLFAVLIAAQAWAPAGAAFVLAVYAHQARIDDGSDES